MVDTTAAGNIRDVFFSDPEVAKRLSHDISDAAARRREPWTNSKFFGAFRLSFVGPGVVNYQLNNCLEFCDDDS